MCQGTKLHSHHERPIQMSDLSLDVMTKISDAFSAGNFADAYGDDVSMDDLADHERSAYVLGYYSGYALRELSADARDEYDQAYHSEIGRYVVEVARYCDSRADEYAEESVRLVE